MKEKKIVLSVILGVSLVALITALVAGFVDGLSLLIDGGKIKDIYYADKYNCTVGSLELGLIGLGIAYVTVFICTKNKRRKVSIILSAVLAGYFVITAIVLRYSMPLAKKEIYDKSSYLSTMCYTLFTSYLTTAIAITVSAVLICVSALLLAKAKKDEEINQAENKSVAI